jgi:hypothetical protein
MRGHGSVRGTAVVSSVDFRMPCFFPTLEMRFVWRGSLICDVTHNAWSKGPGKPKLRKCTEANDVIASLLQSTGEISASEPCWTPPALKPPLAPFPFDASAGQR